ncbi:hypothetical protein ANN_00080 [Periplaneta americana]|uniref:Reverse transcriptase domain-containing protein n=1 Tax=Periplaneta americana TaxID=6978 RepID=A0ABQ8TPU5_PERAM|nr:hypothetical protein ANN_00080 [Periplaneta americana]
MFKVYNYFKNVDELNAAGHLDAGCNVANAQETTAEACGVGLRTVQRILLVKETGLVWCHAYSNQRLRHLVPNDNNKVIMWITRRETDKAKEDWMKKKCKEIEDLERRERYDLMYSEAKCLDFTNKNRKSMWLIEDELGNEVTDRNTKHVDIISRRKSSLASGRKKGTRDAIGQLRTIGERYLEKNKEVYVEFVDLEKAFERVDWNKMMGILKKIGVDWLFSNLHMKQRVKSEVEKFKYLRATVTNINDTREEIKRRINLGNACYYSVGKLLSSSLLSKNLKVRIYKTVILPVVLYGCETWTLTLREEQRLRVFENKVLRKIFGAKRDEVTGEWRKLHNAELHALYSSPDIIKNIKSRRLR